MAMEGEKLLMKYPSIREGRNVPRLSEEFSFTFACVQMEREELKLLRKSIEMQLTLV